MSSPVEFEEDLVEDPNGETLTVEASMEPLQMETMTKSKDGFLGVRRGVSPQAIRGENPPLK